MDFTLRDLAELHELTERDVIIENGGNVISFITDRKRHEQTKT